MGLSQALTSQACLQGNPGGALSVDVKGTRATKAQLAAGWRDVFGDTTTGHSTRRSGALPYIRKGQPSRFSWEVEEQHYLGAREGSTANDRPQLGEQPFRDFVKHDQPGQGVARVPSKRDPTCHRRLCAQGGDREIGIGDQVACQRHEGGIFKAGSFSTRPRNKVQ